MFIPEFGESKLVAQKFQNFLFSFFFFGGGGGGGRTKRNFGKYPNCILNAKEKYSNFHKGPICLVWYIIQFK